MSTPKAASTEVGGLLPRRAAEQLHVAARGGVVRGRDGLCRRERVRLLDADGRVSAAGITRGERADAALGRCVLERVHRLRLLAAARGHP